MVTFGSGYYMPMDREYDAPSKPTSPTNDVGVSIGELGTSVSLGPVPNVSALGAKMRAGSKTMEINFSGAGKGSGQGHTPGMYGKLQRQALKEMQKANKYDFTTHATYSVYGLAGMDQQGNFSKQSKNMAIDEIKRAIEFAGDVSNGGTIVVHTGEFQRPLVDASWNKDNKFKMYEGEEERATFKVVDARTGGIIQEARKNRKVSRPVWLTAEEDNPEHHVKKGDYVDYWGKKINRAERVPVYKDGRFVTKQMGWEELEAEAQEMTREFRETYEQWESGKMTKEEFNESIWRENIQRAIDQEIPAEKLKVRPEEAYIISTLENQAANSRGFAHYYGGNFDEDIKRLEKFEKAKKLYQEIETATDPEEKWKLKKKAENDLQGLIPTEDKFPTEIIDQQINQIKRHMNQAREGAASQWSQAAEAEETIRHVQSAEDYALNESYDAYAQAGLTAMMRSNQLEKKGQLKNPLSVSMENIFPESYGSHPDELKDLVLGTRERMKQMLVHRGYSEKNACKEAREHVNATFDTGHFNMWRKYWKGDSHKTIDQNDNDFNKWAINKVVDLTKSGVIEHVHLTDNYGYADDHLAPGEGNAPIRDMVKALKENGFKGQIIVEPGADFTTDSSGFNTMTKAWKYFGSNVGAGGSWGSAGRPWGDVQYGWFGQNQPAYFTFGGYSPSEEWTLWSGVPLE